MLCLSVYLRLSIKIIRLYVCRNLGLPLVAVVQQFLLVVEQLLVCFRGEFKVGSLHDSIDRTGLLTKSTIDALRHVDVVASCPPSTVSPFLSLDGNSLLGRE